MILHNSIYVFPKGTNLHTAPRSSALFVVYYKMAFVGIDTDELLSSAYFWEDLDEHSIIFEDFAASFDEVMTEDGYEELSEGDKAKVDEIMGKFEKCAGLYKVGVNNMFSYTPFIDFITRIDGKSVSFWNRDAYSFFTAIRLKNFEKETNELIRRTKDFIRDGKVPPAIAGNLAKLIGEPSLKLTDVYSTRKNADVSFVLFDRENLQGVENALDNWLEGVK